MGHQSKNLLRGLLAVHCLLHLRVKILHTETQAVEAQLKQMREALPAHGPWIDLDRILPPRLQLEPAFEHVHQA
ncbi:hypothetical protein D3C72_1807370 [compost metagenome]